MEQNLPAGSKAFSGSSFINPQDSSLWTGFIGSYLRIATHDEVTELINSISIDPSNLGIAPYIGFEHRVPVTRNGETFSTGGLIAHFQYDFGGGNTLVLRSNGRIQTADGTTDFDAVNYRQLQNIGLGVHEDNLNSNISGASRSLILKSVNSNITNPDSTSSQNAIVNSSDSEITGNRANLSAIISSNGSKMTSPNKDVIIGSDECEIQAQHIQSAIIASTQSKIEIWQSIGTAKWNCAIIAGKLSVMRGNASYCLVTGKGTIGHASAQFVCGQNNLDETPLSVDDPNKKNFIVGNGTGSDDTQPTVRSNAFHVTQGGKAWVQKELEVDSPDGVILKAPNGNRYRITVSNTGQLTTTQI